MRVEIVVARENRDVRPDVIELVCYESGKKTPKNERARKQCPIASDINQTWRHIGIRAVYADENVISGCAE